MITNELNLPQPLVDAIVNDSYAKGERVDFSTTELISPPRIAQLRRKHRQNISEDAADRIFSLLGQSVHGILERAAGERYIVEKRYYIEHDGARIAGQIDCFDKETGTLQDWKITSRYSTQDGPKPEWVAQGNINRYLMESNDQPVKAIEYIAIFRDWSKMAVARGTKDYPQRQVEVLKIPLWPIQKVKDYLSERIALHRAAAVSLPDCTPEERWSKPPKFALMRKGKKRAIKLYETEAEAESVKDDDNMISPGQPYFVEARSGEETRCLFYCSCAPFCEFGRNAQLEAAKA